MKDLRHKVIVYDIIYFTINVIGMTALSVLIYGILGCILNFWQ